MMYLLGGHGIPKSDAEGVKWLRKASAHGNAGAQWWLGSMYFNGRQVPKNNAEGMKWLRLAADQGFTQAQVSLGASTLMEMARRRTMFWDTCGSTWRRQAAVRLVKKL